MALLYKADPVRGEQWQRLFAKHAPDIQWRAWPDIGDPRDIRYLAAWQAPDDIETVLPNLKVLFALSAGVRFRSLNTGMFCGPVTMAS